ncbi:MAG: hypothetical protein AB8B53_13675 [Flavobacteriales bacterium]
MIKFFRRIRQRMLSENKFSKYLLYALGEIILVVIGILFALQINNWNTGRTDQLAIDNYYEKIHLELQGAIARLDDWAIQCEPLIAQNRRSLRILDSGNRDSIPALAESLGALGTAWTLSIPFPVTDEFLSQDYLSKIDNDSIKQGFLGFNYAQEDLEWTYDYTIEQYSNRIEPFFNKHINYSEVAMERYRPQLVIGGPSTNYEALFNSLELWNIVTFKLENLTGEARMNLRTRKRLEWLDEQIVKELERRKSD